ncbi:hypothetical protein DSM112329_04592 [Paraconexibacter sp. AEG42_29]|uniref:DUF559 domain-containing protein n=1 Tax=Paraconexibacter sp. AEG42_29 TaxID=2997339 RepID=A0AAU7B1A9_9ACTN
MNASVMKKVRRVAERQHGRITWAELRKAGVSESQIRRLCGRGWLVREHRGVYLVGHKQRPREATFASALLTMGDDATLSFHAAGAQWEVLRGAVRTTVTIPPGTRRRGRPTITVHRAELPPEHVTIHRGLRVTTLVRTLLDLAAVLPLSRLERVFEQAQVLHKLDPDELAAEVLCRRGYRGTPNLRAVLEGAVDPAAVASVLELRFLRLCDAYGIPRPLVNEPLGPWVPDFRWPGAWLVVETDGKAFHATAAQRRRDAEKDAWLRERGYTVIRLSWSDVTRDPAATAARIKAALAGAR